MTPITNNRDAGHGATTLFCLLRNVRAHSLCNRIQDKGTQSYKLKSNGELETYHCVGTILFPAMCLLWSRLCSPARPTVSHSVVPLIADLSCPALKLEDVRKLRKCEFWQADPSNLDPKYQDFDVVLAQNVLSQMYNPAAFLKSIHTRIALGGLLVVADTFDWDEAATPREAWLGGFKHAGENVYSVDGMEKILSHAAGNGGKFVLVQIPSVAPSSCSGSSTAHSAKGLGIEVPLVVSKSGSTPMRLRIFRCSMS